jgi:hypothetical protein
MWRACRAMLAQAQNMVRTYDVRPADVPVINHAKTKLEFSEETNQIGVE